MVVVLTMSEELVRHRLTQRHAGYQPEVNELLVDMLYHIIILSYVIDISKTNILQCTNLYNICTSNSLPGNRAKTVQSCRGGGGESGEYRGYGVHVSGGGVQQDTGHLGCLPHTTMKHRNSQKVLSNDIHL